MTIAEGLPGSTGPVSRLPARAASRILQIGTVAVVLMALPYTAFDLDRFLIPKELVLHLTAILAVLFAIGALRRTAMTRVDLLLAAFVLLGAVSALFATNRWLALRAVAVSASAVLVFWVARSLREADLQRRVLAAVALAVVVAAAMSLLQAYGVRADFFSLNRAPGGTLGNRNFVAHVAAFGLPVCMYLASSSATPLVGIAITSAALVLTRSRGAWLAAAVMLAIFLVAMFIGREWPGLKRFPLMIIAAAAGVAAALFLPNALRWRSDNPYLESVQSVANYQEGSGRGRLVQYERSLAMAVHHPLLGVGPGNWPVVYPEFAPRSDPSMNDSQPGMTFNPWPSSDWIAYISERGLVDTILLALALVVILTQKRAAALHRITAVAIVAAVVVEGMFDAVLLLAVPALLVWAALGALDSNPEPPARTLRLPIILGVFLIALAGAVSTAGEVFAMTAYANASRRSTLERASAAAPGNYRLHMRLAQSGRSRCMHARAAHELFPRSAEAAHAARSCR